MVINMQENLATNCPSYLPSDLVGSVHTSWNPFIAASTLARRGIYFLDLEDTRHDTHCVGRPTNENAGNPFEKLGHKRKRELLAFIPHKSGIVGAGLTCNLLNACFNCNWSFSEQTSPIGQL